MNSFIVEFLLHWDEHIVEIVKMSCDCESVKVLGPRMLHVALRGVAAVPPIDTWRKCGLVTRIWHAFFETRNVSS